VGLPPAPRGLPQIEVTFDIDANGIVNVSAQDKATGAEQRITISGSSGLSKDEVERMVKDAEAHASDDRARRERIDARNEADALVYSVEKTLSEHRSKLPAEEVARVQAAIDTAKAALTTEDVAALRSAISGLQAASRAMAEALYKVSGSQPSSEPTGAYGSSSVKDGEVVDAEYAETR